MHLRQEIASDWTVSEPSGILGDVGQRCEEGMPTKSGSQGRCCSNSALVDIQFSLLDEAGYGRKQYVD